MRMKQCTIKAAATVKGVGLHTGEVVTLTMRPAPENHGYKFRRIDLPEAPLIAADANKVVATNRGTVIKEGIAQVSTVEHVLSALIGLGIDNVLLEIDGGEVPILDGSALIYVQKITEAGIEEQNAAREYFDITEIITFKDEKTGAEYVAMPAEEYCLTTMIDFNSEVLGQQFATDRKSTRLNSSHLRLSRMPSSA